MDRRAQSHLALLALLALTACGARAEKPNLLVIVVDTLRADHLGAHGYARDTSPHIDALFDESLVFEQAHSTSSWTLPAMASLWTSQHASTHGCWQFHHALDPSFTTLAEVLTERGYRTHGVVSHVFLGSDHGLQQGFSSYDEELVAETLEDSHLALTSPRLTEKALAFLDEVSAASGPDDTPWFLMVHYFDPHSRYLPHEGEVESFGPLPEDRYDGEVVFTDRHVGALLSGLTERGLAGNTIVCFVADHGEEFGDHRGIGHGKTLYREVERVPLALRLPGLAPRRLDTPVSLVDVMPTLLDLLAIPEGDLDLSGRSFSGLLRGEAPDLTELPPDAGLLLESRLDLRADATLAGWIEGHFKLIVVTARGDAEPGEKQMLFDLHADPTETNDLAAERPQVVARLRAAMDRAVSRAEARASAFGVTPSLDLSPAERARLDSLGYTGD